MNAKQKILGLAAVPLIIGISGCGSNEEPSAPDDEMAATMEGEAMPGEVPGGNQVAMANLQTAQGAEAGTATITSPGEGLSLSLRVQGLPPGEHGAHIHQTGSCEAPTFESAGGHWNPADKQHGLENAQGQHAGDMPNLVVAGDGTGTLEYKLEGGNIDALLDTDGSAMVIHASADDQMTDPSGNSGDRIACGVFSAN